MAIYNITAEWKDSDNRVWRGFWKRKAVGHSDAQRRAMREISIIGGDWKRIKTDLALDQDTGVHVIGNSGRIMCIEQGGHADRVIHFADGQWRTMSDLTPTEYDYVKCRVFDL